VPCLHTVRACRNLVAFGTVAGQILCSRADVQPTARRIVSVYRQ